jgi:hypothetical protein
MSGLQFLVRFFAAATARPGTWAFCGALALVLNLSAVAQQPAPAQSPSPAPAVNQPATAPAAQAPAVVPGPAAKPAATQSSKSGPSKEGEKAEEALKKQLVGKPLYLRGGYLDNTLSFNEHGGLFGHSPQGSHTLNGIQIDKVHLTKHKLELEGARYGLRFLGSLTYDDPTKAVDRVNITPKKKQLKITIDREVVVSPKKKKVKEKESNKGKNWKANAAVLAQVAPAAATVAQPATQPAEVSEADQVKAQIAAAPPAERPADPGSVTATHSSAHAAKVLQDALDRIFAPGIDDRLVASMPRFWRLYYQAAAANTDYRPSDPAVLRQDTVDKKARLLSAFEPQSNEYAQAHAVVGVAVYHAVIGADGKPGEIAVGRPIGFGLDENAVEAIRKASFEPAIKDCKPVPVLLDLVVQFRIYSQRTTVSSKPEAADKPAEPALPGPYSVQHP